MRSRCRLSGPSALFVCLATLVSCRGAAPGDPTATSPTFGPDGGGGTVGAKANNPPAAVARVTPAPAGGVVSGALPLDVRINLCQSSDPDPADSIRFDVTWGDGVETGPGRPGAGTAVEDGERTGCEGRDCCRHRHRYENAGTFQVEARVSDKHLEDQSGSVAAQAISRYRFVVTTGTVPAAGGAGCTTITSDVGGLNGTSTNSTFEIGITGVALPTEGWANVTGTAQVFDLVPPAVYSGALVGTSAYGNYQVQYATGVAIQPSTTYTLSLDMGYLAGLTGGNSGYSFQLGTLNGGVFTGLGAPVTGTAPYAGNMGGGTVSASAQQVFVTGATVSGDSLAVRWAQTSSLGGGTSDFFGFDNVILRAARCAP